jgi:hypothetical protein
MKLFCVQLAGKRKTAMLDETAKGIATHIVFSNSHVTTYLLIVLNSSLPGKPSNSNMGDGRLTKREWLTGAF